MMLAVFHASLSLAQPIRTNIPGCGEPLKTTDEFRFNSATSVVSGAKIRLGTNILYWIDTKQDWNEFQLGKLLTDLNIKALRYPGGEVADNYDWSNNEIERDNRFPKEAKTALEKHNRLDYQSFLKKASDIGIKDFYFVANLESAFLRPGNIEENILKYARSAAQWIAAIRKAGYSVKYWEIGNESYLYNTAYPLTAKEYAHALHVFSKEMKGADPNILIGAVGPLKAEVVGFADRLNSNALNAYRTSFLNGEPLCNDDGNACAKKLNSRKIYKGKAWWPQLMEYAPDAFDFVAVHEYKDYTTPGINKRKATDDIFDLKNFLDNTGVRKLPIAITEWNILQNENASEFNSNASKSDQAIEVAALLLGYYRAGVQDALFWPFRMKGDRFNTLVNPETGMKYPVYETLSLFNYPIDAESFFSTTPLPDGIEVVESRLGKQSNDTSVIGVNIKGKDFNLNQPVRPAMNVANLTISQLNSKGDKLERLTIECHGIKLGTSFVATLPAKSLIKINFQYLGKAS